MRNNLDLINIKYPEHILDQNSHLFDSNDWDNISSYQTLSETFMEKYQDKLSWYSISLNQKLSESFIEKYENRMNWYNISRFQFLSISFVKKYQDDIYWDWLYVNINIPITTKLLFAPHFNWINICQL